MVREPLLNEDFVGWSHSAIARAVVAYSEGRLAR
jgi:hypothetical protein